MKLVFVYAVYLSYIIGVSSTPIKKSNGNYILMLDEGTSIARFMPQFLENMSTALGQSHVVENTKIIKRDTNEERLHVFDAYDFGASFKAVAVRLDNSLLHILKQNKNVLEIIPDQTIKFNLPTSKLHKSKYYNNANDPIVSSSRNSAFNLDHLEQSIDHSLDRIISTIEQFDDIQSESGMTATLPKQTSFDKQENAQWNLVRISEQNRDLKRPYIYDSEAGSNVNVYVLDDGMNIEHEEFEGRASWGWSAYSNVSQLGGGHGTHVAGIIGSVTYGVAKKTNLIAVQVLDEGSEGAYSNIISGLQWVKEHAKSNTKKRSVINMSLSGPKSGSDKTTIDVLQRAISAVVKEANIPIIVAAGNDANDACEMMPGGMDDVFTVSASSIVDEFADFSAYGKCVQIIAPGVSIKSAFIGSKSATSGLSGTSMASPHVAGVAALLLANNPSLTPQELYNKLKEIASHNMIKSIKGDTPNLLLFNGQTSRIK